MSARAARRRWAVAALIFVALLLAGAWPWPRARMAFGTGYSAFANLLLETVSFGNGGHARLQAAAPTTVRRPGEQVTSDAKLELTVDGHTGHLDFGLNLRRDAYLPLLIFAAAVTAAPLGRRRKLRGLLVGLAVVALFSLLSIYLLVLWLFSHQLRGVYPADPWFGPGVDLLFRLWLLPPGNRFVVPMLVAATIIVTQLRATMREQPAALPDASRPRVRPRWLFALTIGLGLLAPAGAQAAIQLAPVMSGGVPVFVTHAGDRRLFIVDLGGRIRIFDPGGGGLLPTPFLDIAAKISTGGERGLLSMAFHPDYASNRLFYVNYTNLAGDTVIERYRTSANPNLADGASGATLLVIAQPFSNHNGGQLQVGPRDGHLYVGMGDGGAAGDPECRAQRPDTLLGKMLRLDIRQNLDRAPFHGIPADNPFVGSRDPGNTVPDEIWAFGLRNPWRFSFDRATGDLYIGDVGQNAVEEIDRQPASSAGGENYGWKVMEGNACFSTSACPAGTPACGSALLTSPIHTYSHASGGCSITGGYVYRGTRAPELSGKYLFGDLCTRRISALSNVGGTWQSEPVAQGNTQLTSFGEDFEGELYATLGNDVFKLVSDSPPPAVPAIGRAGLAGAGCRPAGHGPLAIAPAASLSGGRTAGRSAPVIHLHVHLQHQPQAEGHVQGPGQPAQRAGDAKAPAQPPAELTGQQGVPHVHPERVEVEDQP